MSSREKERELKMVVGLSNVFSQHTTDDGVGSPAYLDQPSEIKMSATGQRQLP